MSLNEAYHRQPSLRVGPGALNNALAASIVVQMAPEIRDMLPEATRLTTMLMKMAKKRVANPTWYHREREPMPHIVKYIGATESSASATPAIASFSNPQAIYEDCTIFNTNTGSWERTLCTATPSSYASGNFAFTRNLDGGANVFTQGDVLLVMAPAREFGDDRRPARSTVEVAKTFGIQNMRYTYEMTDVMATVETYHANERLDQHKLMMRTAKVAFELSVWFGLYSADLGGSSYYQPSMKGILEFVDDHVSAMPQWTFSGFEKFLEGPAYFHNDGQGWYAYCSGKVMSIINQICRDRIQTKTGDTRFGTNMKYLETAHGEVELVKHPLWVGPWLSGLMVLIPKPVDQYVQLRYLAGNGLNHDWAMHLNVGLKDVEILSDEFKGKLGTELWEQYKWGVLHSITA